MALKNRLKIIDKLVIRSFVGPYMLSFFIAQFVLVMQFLWKYIDDILGKGFSVIDLLELITYFGITQIPRALPIAILLASVMVFGNMSERYELSSMKSAGVSLIRIMRPAIMLSVLTALLSLLASNYLGPQANLQFQKRLRVMKAQKPSLSLEAKIFNRDFGGYSIRVDEKDEFDNIEDVLIYDHTDSDKSLMNLTKAKNGKMYNDGSLFIMELNDGTSYREMKRERRKDGNGKKYPFMRTDFAKWKKVFDLSEFDTEDPDAISINRNREDMLNTFQLITAIDSVNQEAEQLTASIVEDERNQFQKFKEEGAALNEQSNTARKKNNNEDTTDPVEKDRAPSQSPAKRRQIEKMMQDNKIMPAQTINKQLSNNGVIQLQVDTLSLYQNWYETVSPSDKNNIAVRAVQSSSRRKDLLRNVTTNIKSISYRKERYVLRLNQQYSFALICIIFLFIGAPLGSIIRKGGYGYPLLFAILFYMLFIITTIMGEKLVKSESMNPIIAAWLSNLLVLPVAVWLTIMALRDKKFERSRFVTYIINLISRFRSVPASEK